MNNSVMKPITEFCSINMGQSPDSKTYNEKGEGIPFYQGNADFGEMHPKTRVWCSAPVKIANKDDILISVRAPIGAMNIATEKCCIGRGLAAITPNEDKCKSEYLFYALKSKTESLIAQGTGSTFKAISRKVLEGTQIPDYNEKEQEFIIEVMSSTEKAIKIKNEELENLEQLIKTRFVEMFGDPVRNSMSLPTKTLPELGEFGRGVSKHRPRNAPELLGGKYPLIQTGEVANSELYITSYSNTYSEIGFKQSRMWDKGTLCITIAANIAKTAILTFDACFPDSVVGFNANRNTNNIFIHYWFSFFQAILEEQAPESAQKNINLKVLSNLEVIVPPIELQQQFAEFVEQVEKAKQVIKQQLEELETLKKSLMQKYFG